MKECAVCNDPFKWNDDVIKVDDNPYHKDCVKLYPTGFVAYLDDEFLGKTENEDGQMACEIIDELLDDE